VGIVGREGRKEKKGWYLWVRKVGGSFYTGDLEEQERETLRPKKSMLRWLILVSTTVKSTNVWPGVANMSSGKKEKEDTRDGEPRLRFRKKTDSLARSEKEILCQRRS